MKIAVIGMGVAGTAAAWGGVRAGHEVVAFDGGSAASTAWSGALDSPGDPVAADVVAFVEALGYVPGPARVVAPDGSFRDTAARDAAVVNVGNLRPGPIVLAEAPAPAWNADWLARRLRDDDAGRPVETRRLALPESDLDALAESGTLGSHFDDDESRQRLEAALQKLATNAAAVVLGPWLAAPASLVGILLQGLGSPVGEVLSGVDGPAGRRFEGARDRLLTSLSVPVRPDHVARVAVDGDALEVSWVDARGPRSEAFDRVVLAVGGITGGGVRHRQGEFEVSLDGPLDVIFQGSPYPRDADGEGPVSLGGGSDLAALGIRPASSVPDGMLRVAGDAQPDRPRVALEAVASGLAAVR